MLEADKVEIFVEYQRLGRTALDISRLGFGCWAIGGHGYGRVDDAESISAIRRALDLGVNWFDTADIYGFGHSEKILAEALGNKGVEVVIGTKFGICWDGSGRTYRDCSPERVFKAVDDSLRRLRIDCIPIYHIHWHDGRTPIVSTMEALCRCQEAGKIRYIGCSNLSMDLIKEARTVADMSVVQVMCNVIQQPTETEMTALKRFGMAMTAYGVLGRGLLTGKYDSNVSFGENDTRAKDENFSGRLLERNLAVVARLRSIGKRYGKSPAHVAIRFVLDRFGFAGAMIGHKTSNEVEDNVRCLHWTLDDEDMQNLLSCLAL